MNLFQKNNKIYNNIFITLLTFVFTITIVNSSILYFYFQKYMISHIYSSEVTSLTQSSYSASVLSEYANTLAKQMYSDPTVSKLRYYRDLDTAELRTGLVQLDALKSNTNLVYSVYVYNSYTKTIYSSSVGKLSQISPLDSFFDSDIVDIIHDPGKYKRYIPISREIPMASNNGKTKFIPGFSFLICDYNRSDNSLDNAIIINITETWMINTIKNLNPNINSNTFIIDKKGNILVSNSDEQPLDKTFSQKLAKKVLDSKNISGYFIDSVNNEKSLIIYLPYTRFEWIYIRTIPYNSLLSKISLMKFVIIFTALFLLIVGFMISFYRSRKIYKPIDDVMVKLKSLESEKRSINLEKKQEYLRSLLKGEKISEIAVGQDSNSQSYFTLAPNEKYLIFLFMIDDYKTFCSKFSLSDRNLFRFAILNIASEICTPQYNNETVDMGNNHVALLVKLNKEDDISETPLSGMIKEIQVQVKQHLGISLSCSISTISTDVREVSAVYISAENASFYRLFNGYSCIIFSDRIASPAADEYSYAVNKEKILVDALLSGNTDEANEMLNSILDEVSKFSYAAFQLTLNHLAFALSGAVLNIEKVNDCKFNFNMNSFISELSSYETLDQIKMSFNTIFNEISLKLDENKNQKYDKLVEKIIKMINETYYDQNLSVSSIADAVDLSAPYISRLFKRYTTKSIVDYINEVRMEKAKELLLKNDKTINEIALSTGFTNNQYFHKVFKKTFGTTPNQIRKSS